MARATLNRIPKFVGILFNGLILSYLNMTPTIHAIMIVSALHA